MRDRVILREASHKPVRFGITRGLPHVADIPRIIYFYHTRSSRGLFMVTTLQRDRLTTQTNPAPDSRKLIGIYHLPIGPNLGPVHTGWELA